MYPDVCQPWVLGNVQVQVARLQRFQEVSSLPFQVAVGGSVLARLPLLPAWPSPAKAEDGGVGPLLAEGIFVSAQQGDAGSRLLSIDGLPTPRQVATLRAYEQRARWRPTPHGIFAGVQVWPGKTRR